MRLSLKARIVLLLMVLTAIPTLLYFYHNSAMRKEILQSRQRFNQLYASSVVSRVELFLERVLSETESLIYLYRNLGFSEEQIIWRITGQVKGIFEGAFYSPEGVLLSFASRESVKPSFERFLDPDVLKLPQIGYSQYREPFLRFALEERDRGMVRGIYVFSLDLSLFWQSVVSAKPSPAMEVFLTNSEGEILAFSDMRFSSRRKIPLRIGTYRSSITGTDVVGVFSKSEDGRWVVVVEEPLSSVLEPLQSFQRKALLAGSAFMLSGGVFAILVFLRIFRPLENLRDFIVSWEEENIRKRVKASDEVEELSQAFGNLIRRLEEERKLYSALFENTLDGVILFNSERRVIDVNRTVLEQFNLKREELIGRSMADLVGENLPFTSLFFSERKIKLKEEIYCQLRQEVLNIEGSLYLLWRLRDLSQEKELKVLLEHTAKLSLAGEIACSIAHQINNPLASIMGYAESLEMTCEDENIKRKARVIIKQARKCAETVRKLLEIGKPIEGKPQYINPEEVTVDAVTMLSPKAKKKGVSISFKSNLNGSRLYAFPWQIEQVLVNLIDNAIDASPEGEVVEVTLTEEKGKIVWRIRDKGPGIPEEEIEKIFKPFYTTKDHGTGLGLPLARRFVKNMGGDLKVKSSKGAGTTVEVVFGKA